jgi:hypothetical protein
MGIVNGESRVWTRSQICEKQLLLCHVCLYVCPSAWKNSSLATRILMKFNIWVFIENLSRIFKYNENRTKIRGTLHEAQYVFLIFFAHFFLKWEMFQTNLVEKIKTHILCSTNFFGKSFLLWEKVEKYSRAGQTTDDNTAHAHYMLGN